MHLPLVAVSHITRDWTRFRFRYAEPNRGVCCSVLQCITVCCSVLQCVAVCCSVLQWTAVCCNVVCAPHIKRVGLHTRTPPPPPPPFRPPIYTNTHTRTPTYPPNRSTTQTDADTDTEAFISSAISQKMLKECNTLQRNAIHCNAMQYNATHCKVLWSMPRVGGMDVKHHTADISVTQHFQAYGTTLYHTALYSTTQHYTALHYTTLQHTHQANFLRDSLFSFNNVCSFHSSRCWALQKGCVYVCEEHIFHR